MKKSNGEFDHTSVRETSVHGTKPEECVLVYKRDGHVTLSIRKPSDKSTRWESIEIKKEDFSRFVSQLANAFNLTMSEESTGDSFVFDKEEFDHARENE